MSKCFIHYFLIFKFLSYFYYKSAAEVFYSCRVDDFGFGGIAQAFEFGFVFSNPTFECGG